MDGQRSRVTVIGAGVMGRGIAYASVIGGLTTHLVDVDHGQLEAALRQIDTDLTGAVDRGKLTREQATSAKGRLTTYDDLSQGCEDADLLIEAVVERLPIKHEVLSAAEAAAADHAVLATNTSAMSITEISACLTAPDKGVGMHFFNPVPKMKLCEVIRGLETSDRTVDIACSFAEQMGKTSVVISDVPGFATSRINALIGMEAMRMLEERVASPEDIDTAIRLGLNHPMGPLEMGDLVGWDTRLDIFDYLASTLGDRFRPTNLHRRLVAAGRFGRKSGRGVYEYDDTGRQLPNPSDLGS